VKLVKRWKKDPTSIAAAITLPAKAMSANLSGVRGKLDRREVADGTTLKLGKIAGSGTALAWWYPQTAAPAASVMQPV
jgi:hypothetical protein